MAISLKWVSGVIVSAILVMIVIYAFKKVQVPVISKLANEV